jgi:hypothetical protein
MALLRGIAALRAVPLATNARDDAAAQLAAALAGPDATEIALGDCSPGAQAAWDALRAAGGRMKLAVFSRTHGAIRPIGPGKLEREQTWQRPETPAEELWYRGLIFRAFADLGDGPVETVYIPAELLPPIPPQPPRAAVSDNPSSSAGADDFGRSAAAIPAAPSPPRSRQAFNLLAVDVCAVLAAARDAPVRLDKEGLPREADMARLREGLALPDGMRADLLLALARGRGWLLPERDRLALHVTAATAWLRLTTWEQMTSLFTAWRDDAGFWNDLWHVPGLQAEGEWRNDPLPARRAVLDLLRGLAGDTWYAIAGLVAGIKAVNPDFQRPDGNYSGWYLRDVETGRYLSGFESWDDVEGRLIRFLVTGPLFWLGAVALGAGDEDPPEALRLTPSGAAWLAGTTPGVLPRPSRLSVAEDFAISAPLTLPLLDRYRLLRFTEPVAGGYELGQPTRHRITRAALARARAGGIKAEAVLKFLERASGGRVPARVAAGLARWDQHGGTVRVSKGAVLRVEEASTLSTLRADPVIAPLLGDLLSAQAALVSEVNLPKLLTALEQLGYTAKVE